MLLVVPEPLVGELAGLLGPPPVPRLGVVPELAMIAATEAPIAITAAAAMTVQRRWRARLVRRGRGALGDTSRWPTSDGAAAPMAGAPAIGPGGVIGARSVAEGCGAAPAWAVGADYSASR